MASDSDTATIDPYAWDNFDVAPQDLGVLTLKDATILNAKFDPFDNRPTAIIRTSDTLLFRRCRRAWGWSSHLKEARGPRNAASPLWLGSGFHFALEDFHGPNVYGHPTKALQAYAIATHRWRGRQALPGTWVDDLVLGKAMLAYYADEWLRNRSPLETFVWDGVLQTEVNFRIEIPLPREMLDAYGYKNAVYSGTLDRVVIDENGTLWIVEYKTAKAIQTNHYETDSQISRYCWAASLLYPGYPIGGVIYQQHRKTLPDEPRTLSNGKLSTSKSQSTDYFMYRKAVIDRYGSVQGAPGDVLATLNHFASLEEPTHNKFVRRDSIYRNAHQCEAEGTKILLEVSEMLNPELPLYPNATRECGFCTFKGPCIAMDDGSDWVAELEAYTMPRDLVYDSWRQYLPTPAELDQEKVKYTFD
jgi:hypothetical protein